MPQVITPVLPDRRGFSLVQVSLLLVVGSIAMVSVLPGGQVGSDKAKSDITLQRMQKIEEATHAFMARNYRRPCPADGSLSTSAGAGVFGKEASTAGNCITTGTLKANFSDFISKTPVTVDAITPTTMTVDITGLAPGMLAVHANLAPGTRIATVDSATQITLDIAATGTITDGTVNFVKIVAGGVPTKSLGLSDEYSFDGYGRRFTYMVDNRATDAQSCRDLQIQDHKGSVKIVNTLTGNPPPRAYVMWALVSHGKDGHGAFPIQGSTIADRINASSADADTLNNASVAADFTVLTGTNFTGKLVRKEPTTLSPNIFDDIVWYLDSMKNTCCIGNGCNRGARIDGNGANVWSQIVTGDLNGDGMEDAVIPMTADVTYPGGVVVYIVFGKKTKWTGPPAGTTLQELLIRKQAAAIVFPNKSGGPYMKGITLAIGDITGPAVGGPPPTYPTSDGIDDLVVGTALDTDDTTSWCPGGCTPYQQFWGFSGRTVWNAGTLANGAYDAEAMTEHGETRNFVFANLAKATTGAVAVGDFDGDGKKDLFVATENNQGYILRGSSQVHWQGDDLDCDTVAPLCAIPEWSCTLRPNYDRNPKEMCDVTKSRSVENTLSPAVGHGAYDIAITGNATNGFDITGAAVGDNSMVAAGDVNDDGYDDIVLRGSGNPTGIFGAAYVLFGRSVATWGAFPQTINLTDQLVTASKAIKFTSSSYTGAAPHTQFALSVKLADVNSDGIKDLLFTSLQRRIEVYFGKPAGTWGAVNLGAAPGANDNGFVIDHDTNKPAGFTNQVDSVAVGDINGDNRPDIIIGNGEADTLAPDGITPLSNAGAIFALLQPAPDESNNARKWQKIGAAYNSIDLFDNTQNGKYAFTVNGNYGEVSGSWVGDSSGIVAAADINADGRSDLLIGAPTYPYTSTSPIGALFILYGKENASWPATGDLTTLTP